eukprot:c4808_g1_i2.p1 GENE.c4808_g1_i2~~c4808_g1_i2.p1  ORF type:complete len:153 (-),score=23.84 c4808_g1_i2:142-600(-)
MVDVVNGDHKASFSLKELSQLPDQINDVSAFVPKYSGKAVTIGSILDEAGVTQRFVGASEASRKTFFDFLNLHLAWFLRDGSVTFIANDGYETSPVVMGEARQGFAVLLGDAPGGPLRLLFAQGVAVQTSPCQSHGGSVNMKGFKTIQINAQ